MPTSRTRSRTITPSLLLAGSSHPRLAAAIAAELGTALGDCRIDRFPDGEIHVEVRESLRGRAVYLVQSTAPPVAEHLLELLLLADACWRGGAARLTAIIPYFGYARQDRRTSAGEALGSGLVARALLASGIDQCVMVDLHSPAIEGAFGMPVVQLHALPALTERLQPSPRRRHVVVAPDLGAAKLAERFGTALRLPVALVHKRRLTGASVAAGGLVGDVRGRSPIVVDDMISTGGTIEAAVQSLLEAGAAADVTVVASHALLVGEAIPRLAALPIRRLVVTDTVARSAAPGPLRLEVVSLAPLIAEEVRRLEQVMTPRTKAGPARKPRR